MLREILKELDDKISASDLDLMIDEIDADGSGTVDFAGKMNENSQSIFKSAFMSFAQKSHPQYNSTGIFNNSLYLCFFTEFMEVMTGES